MMVSKGCPETTVQTPPNPPATKFFTSLVRCFSVMMDDGKQMTTTKTGRKVGDRKVGRWFNDFPKG